MKAIILGAGYGVLPESCRNGHPTAIHEVNSGRRTMDFLLSAFKACGVDEFIFIGGYKIEEIIKLYPSIKFYYNPFWRNTSALASLKVCESELNGEVFITYADVLYSEKTVQQMMTAKSDMAILEDQSWTRRYEGRGALLMESAEKIRSLDGKVLKIGRNIKTDFTGQFAGILKLTSAGACRIKATINNLSSNFTDKPFAEASDFNKAGLTDLLQMNVSAGDYLESVVVADKWAELDAPQDLAQFIFGTKAETLERLQSRVKKSYILDQVRFTNSEWDSEPEKCIHNIKRKFK